MTRDELEADIRAIMNEDFGLARRMGACQRVYDHDAKQRKEIARLREALEGMLFIFGHHDGYAQVKTAKQAFKKE